MRTKTFSAAESDRLEEVRKLAGSLKAKHGARIAGVVSHPHVMDDPEYQRFKGSWDEAYAGVTNAGKTVILEQGAKFEKVGMTFEDLQFLELKKFQVAEIARLFRVPLHMLYDTQAQPRANMEQASLEFVVYTLRPWLVRFEQTIARDLLLPSERARFFAEHNVLYDVLGMDMFGGIAARQIVDDLNALGPIEALDVRVNSSGGDVFEGIAVYNALKRFPAKVTVHIGGIAASIASLIAMAGDKTLISENAMVMVHRPWTAVMGDAEEMRRVAETLDKAWSATLTTYQRRTGRRAATVAQRVTNAGGEWWMTAAEAVAEGFADEVVKAEKQAQVFGLHRFRKVPAQLAASGADAVTPPVLDWRRGRS